MTGCGESRCHGPKGGAKRKAANRPRAGKRTAPNENARRRTIGGFLIACGQHPLAFQLQPRFHYIPEHHAAPPAATMAEAGAAELKFNRLRPLTQKLLLGFGNGITLP